MDEQKDDRSMDTLLEDFIDQESLRFEGDTGVENLEKVAKAIGYSGHQFRYGSPLEAFLSDNPGDCVAIIEWIKEQNLPEWMDVLENELEEETPENEE